MKATITLDNKYPGRTLWAFGYDYHKLNPVETEDKDRIMHAQTNPWLSVEVTEEDLPESEDEELEDELDEPKPSEVVKKRKKRG